MLASRRASARSSTRHVVHEAVQIRNVRLPVAIQSAITEKLEAAQKALKMKYVIAESEAENQKQLINEKGEAERRKIDSQARADAVRIEAEAAGDAKRSDGKATADDDETVKKSLSPALIRLREIEAWKDVAKSPNSKLIISGDALRPPTVVDIRGADAAAKWRRGRECRAAEVVARAMETPTRALPLPSRDARASKGAWRAYATALFAVFAPDSAAAIFLRTSSMSSCCACAIRSSSAIAGSAPACA